MEQEQYSIFFKFLTKYLDDESRKFMLQGIFRTRKIGELDRREGEIWQRVHVDFDPLVIRDIFYVQCLFGIKYRPEEITEIDLLVINAFEKEGDAEILKNRIESKQEILSVPKGTIFSRVIISQGVIE